MGPFLLIDKSVIQGLGFEEIRTLRNHYSIIICPILIDEVAGNLLKDSEFGEENKKKVSILATKSQGLDVYTIGNYESILVGDLLTGKIPLIPQIPRNDGHSVKNKDGTYTHVFGESEEEKLLKRWGEGLFNNEDLKKAEAHLRLKNSDLEKLRKEMLENKPKNFNFGSLREIIKFVDDMYFNPRSQWQLIESTATLHNLPSSWISKIRTRWELQGRPLFWNFSGYAFYCQRLSYIYSLGLTFGFISTSKQAKTGIDFQYLFYLPFVSVFCSWDKFHKEFSENFIRYDQLFVHFEELRNDLVSIKEYFAGLTIEERKVYSIDRGSYPPEIKNSITDRIWKQFCRPWTPGSGNQVSVMTDEQKNKILDRIKEVERNIRGQDGGEPHLLEVKYSD